MSKLFDYQKARILFVDDEDLTRKYFERNFKDTFRIQSVGDAASARKILDEDSDDIGILLTDQRMPGETGVELLEYCRKNHPHILRMLITAYADMDDTIAAINSGAIYKYVSKPYEDFDIELTLKRGMEFYLIQKERDHLLREKFGAMHRSILTERLLSMGVLAAGISHHLRNSLVAVRAFMDLAPTKLSEEKNHADKMNDPKFWKDLYNAAQGQIEQVVEFLGDIEGYVTPKSPVFADTFPLKQCLLDAVTNFQSELEAHHLKISTERLDGSLTMTANRMYLRQAFELLLRERIRLGGEPTEIQMDAEMIPASETLPERIRLKITDPGLTPDEKELAHLFDPFRINPSQPSELGVHLLGAFFLIYHHGGMLDDATSQDKGLTINISLPTDANKPLEPTSEKDFFEKVFQLERLWEDHLLSG